MVKDLTVVSTFAGCGGSSLGYHLAGFKELLAVEWEDHAAETFKLNFPKVPLFHGDIKNLSVKKCLELTNLKPGQLDVFDGSPPCQGFSTAGERRLTDPRNSLFKEYCRLLDGLQPRAFVMENVSGMVKGHMRSVFLIVMQSLRDCGYEIKAEILNAKYFGVPQARERVLIIGFRRDLRITPTFPKPQTKPVNISKLFPGITGHANGQFDMKKKSRFSPAYTVIKTRSMVFYEGDRKRYPTIGECKILCGFPENFKLQGSELKQWARLGNAVPPPLMKAIAEHIKKALLNSGSDDTVKVNAKSKSQQKSKALQKGAKRKS